MFIFAALVKVQLNPSLRVGMYTIFSLTTAVAVYNIKTTHASSTNLAKQAVLLLLP